MRPDSVTTTDAAQGKHYSIAGNNYRIVIAGKDTGGEFAVIDMLIAPGGGPGPHAHKDIQESFFVLEGEVLFMSETQKYTARKGDCITIPKGGAIHCFKNVSNEPAHLLCTVVPAGLDAFFEEIGKPVDAGVFLPAPTPTPEAIRQLTEIGERYGQEFFPPDYLSK